MKVTKKHLKKIVQEELRKLLKEERYILGTETGKDHPEGAEVRTVSFASKRDAMLYKKFQKTLKYMGLSDQQIEGKFLVVKVDASVESREKEGEKGGKDFSQDKTVARSMNHRQYKVDSKTHELVAQHLQQSGFKVGYDGMISSPVMSIEIWNQEGSEPGAAHGKTSSEFLGQVTGLGGFGGQKRRNYPKNVRMQENKMRSAEKQLEKIILEEFNKLVKQGC